MKKQQWTTWLWNPFVYVAGWQAFAVGVCMMAVTAGMAALSGIRFDGVIDIHVGEASSFISQLKLILIDIISMVGMLTIAGMVLSKSEYRIIDIVGTQLVARWPMIFVAVLALVVNLDPIRDAAKNFNPQEVGALFTGTFIFFLCISVLVTIWMIVLMYRSYCISFNLTGNKAVISFIVCLILAEIISKYIIYKIV
ncbi:MAG: hypothetical protein V4590_09965 [Bacteroidota bacterium]